MRRNLVKVIGISFLIFFVLSWIIPVGTYSGGKLDTSGIDALGLIDLFQTPISALVTFALYIVVFAVIGGFWGVIMKTGVLDKISRGWAIRFEGKESRFLVISVIIFSLLSSFTGLIIPLFVLVPLFAAAIFRMGYDKITALASTVGGILIGSIGSIYGFNITGYTKNLLSLDMNNQIWARVIIYVVLTLILCVTVVKSSKRNKETSNHEEVLEVSDDVKKANNSKDASKKQSSKTIDSKKTVKNNSKKSATKKGTSKNSSKKGNTKGLAVTGNVKMVSNNKNVSAVPFAIIFVILLIVAFVGMYNWYYSFNISLFNDIHEAVMGVKINKFKIFEHLFSGSTQFGYWSNLDFATLIFFASFFIGLVYKLKLNETMEAFIGGVKKWMPTALYAALANVILVVLYQTLQGGTGNMVTTISGTIFGWSDGFNPFITALATAIGSFFFNDLYYLLAGMSSFVSGFDSSSLSVAGVLIQSVYSVMMMIFPTSVALIAGLSMFDVSYGKWIKYIWRFALISLLLVLLVCGIITLL